MRLAVPLRSSEIARRAGIRPMSPSWPETFRLGWRALVGWSTRTPVGHGPTGSSGRQPEPEAGVPGGGAALVGASVAPPLIFPHVQLVPAATTDSCEHSQQQVNAGYRARLPALIATLPSPDREIALLGVVAGMSIPDIVATLGVTPAEVRLVLSALQPAATANGSPPFPRQRIVLLPHARTGSADTRPDKRHTELAVPNPPEFASPGGAVHP